MSRHFAAPAKITSGLINCRARSSPNWDGSGNCPTFQAAASLDQETHTRRW